MVIFSRWKWALGWQTAQGNTPWKIKVNQLMPTSVCMGSGKHLSREQKKKKAENNESFSIHCILYNHGQKHFFTSLATSCSCTIRVATGCQSMKIIWYGWLTPMSNRIPAWLLCKPILECTLTWHQWEPCSVEGIGTSFVHTWRTRKERTPLSWTRPDIHTCNQTEIHPLYCLA